MGLAESCEGVCWRSVKERMTPLNMVKFVRKSHNVDFSMLEEC